MATRRQVSIFINGREVRNELGAIYREKRKITSELNNMTIGSEDYIEKAKELRQVNDILDDHRKAIRNTESAWDKLKAGARGFVAVAAAGITADAIIDYGKELFKLGAEMELLGAKAETVFGRALPQVSAAAKQNALDMGLTVSQYIDAAAAIGDLLIPMGFQREEAAALSTNLVGLSGALSEWTAGQVSAEEVSKILSKALLGEREELKQLGISITEADVQARLAEKGLKNLTGQLLEQAKATATLELITEKSTDAQTAFANNTDTLVRKQAQLQAKVQELSENLATILFPIFNRLVDVALYLSRGIESLTDNVGSATRAFDEQQKKVSGLEQELPGLLSRYDELQGKTNKSKEEQAELAEVIKRIGELTPTAITQIDEYGNALSINANASREFLEAEKARLAFVNSEAIAELENEIAKLKTVRDIRKEIVETGQVRGLLATTDAPISLIESARKEVAQFTAQIQGAEAELARLRGDNLPRPGGTGQQPDTISPTEEEIAAAKDRGEKLSKERSRQAQREADEQEKKLQRLKEITERFQEEARLAQLEEDDRKLEEIRLRYQKEIDTARELEGLKKEEVQAIIIELTRLQQEAIAAARQEIDDELYQAELEAIEKQINAELELQAKADEERLKRLEERTERETKLREEAAKKAIEEEKRQLQSLAATANALGNIIGSTLEFYGEQFAKNTAAGKILTGIQIALSTAEGIAKATAAGAGLPFPANLGAIASGIAAVTAGVAAAREAFSATPEVPQRKRGGYVDVLGQDDGRRYRAKYIGQPITGMLPGSPVLVDTVGGPVLASETGQEYFVSNAALRNPVVFNYVRAIDNIARARQFQEGGFTGAPASPIAAPATILPAAENQVNTEMMQVLIRLTNVLESGVYARIDDDTLIDIRNRLNQLVSASGGTL